MFKQVDEFVKNSFPSMRYVNYLDMVKVYIEHLNNACVLENKTFLN